MDQNRWKSPVLWAAIFSLIALVAKNWIGFDIPGWDEITTVCAGCAGSVRSGQQPDEQDERIIRA